MINKYNIDTQNAGKRLDSYLSELCPQYSRAFIQKMIKSEYVKLNGSKTKASTILKENDNITFQEEETETKKILPQDITIEVLYEDDAMLVINKPCNMLTHPTTTETQNTLVNALLFHYQDNLSTCNGKDRPGIVHRLDRNTSGLLMIAKNDLAYEFLKEKMQNRTIEKKYYAIVSGNFENDTGVIDKPIGRHPSKPEKMAIVVDGKPSLTRYKVLERFNGYTFLDINLETGRTHQIRVHLASIGHPIVNDTLYGGKKLPVKTNEQVLQAYSLKFTTPINDVEHHITINPDDDIMKVLNYLRSKKWKKIYKKKYIYY